MLYKGYRNLIPDQTNGILNLLLAANKNRTPDKIGVGQNQFLVSGYRAIKNFGTDISMFGIVIFFELIFLWISFQLAGVQFALVIFSVIAVVIDFVSAYFHNKNRKEIIDARLELNIEQYRLALGIGQTGLVQVKNKEKALKKQEHSFLRVLGVVLIIVSWLFKVFITAITFGLPQIIFAAVVIFGFVAYIHLFHTGAAVIGLRLKLKLNKLAKNKGDNNFNDSVIIANNFTPINFGVTDQEVEALNLKLLEIKRQIRDVTITDAGGNRHTVYDSLVHIDGNNPHWEIKKWNIHFWDDEDVIEFINASDDSRVALGYAEKAYLAYKIYQNMLTGGAYEKRF